MVSQSSKRLSVMTPAEPLIRYFYHVCTDSKKENIISAMASLYSLHGLSLVHFFRSMSWTTLLYYNHVILCPHIHGLYKDTHETKQQP